MSLQDAPLAEERQPQLLSLPGADIASLSNPITTPSCSVPGSPKSTDSSSSSTPTTTVRRHSAAPAPAPAPAPSLSHSHPVGFISPKLTVRTPHSSCRNSLISSCTPAAPPLFIPKERTPSRAATPKSVGSTSVRTPLRDRSPRLPTHAGTASPDHHLNFNFSRTSTHRSSIHSGHDGDVSTSNITPSLNTSLSAAVSHILSSRSSSARTCCHLCPNPGLCRHVCSDPRTCCHVGPRTASRELRQGAPHHQVEPYARSRKADPQGYLFTCYLDYSRFIKPPPPACFDSYVRPEILQYSTCNSACETPRSSTSSSSFISLPAGRRLYSRPPTPAPLIRAKEVHRIAMASVPVDVKELANCYLFVAEIPGLKNTDVKVQVENDSILKISGARRREECEECDIKYIRVERQVGPFTRKFNLPANADLENISAACQDGLLSVVVPKNPPPEQRRPKNFEVKIAT